MNQQETMSTNMLRGDPSGDIAKQVGLLEILLVLAAGKRWIILATLTGGILAGSLTFLAEPRYTSTAIIMPPQQQSSTAASILGQIGPIAGITGADFGLKTPSDLYIGLLSSRTIADRLIARFKLRELYKGRTQIQTRKQLTSRTHFASGKDTLIKISVDDTDPARAADLANAYVDELYQQNTHLAMTESSHRRAFFERQLDQEKEALNIAETEMKKLQQQTGLLQVSSQTEATIRSIAQVQAAVASNEAVLGVLKSGATDENPEVVRRKVELQSMHERLRELESSGQGRKQSGDPMLSVASLPQAGQEYLRRLRDVKYHESLFEALAKQYEIAKLDEIKQAPVIQIVDRAQPPDDSSWPPRLDLTVAGAVGSGILASILVFARHSLQDSQRRKQVDVLKALLFNSKASREQGA